MTTQESESFSGDSSTSVVESSSQSSVNEIVIQSISSNTQVSDTVANLPLVPPSDLATHKSTKPVQPICDFPKSIYVNVSRSFQAFSIDGMKNILARIFKSICFLLCM